MSPPVTESNSSLDRSPISAWWRFGIETPGDVSPRLPSPAFRYECRTIGNLIDLQLQDELLSSGITVTVTAPQGAEWATPQPCRRIVPRSRLLSRCCRAFQDPLVAGTRRSSSVVPRCITPGYSRSRNGPLSSRAQCVRNEFREASRCVDYVVTAREVELDIPRIVFRFVCCHVHHQCRQAVERVTGKRSRRASIGARDILLTGVSRRKYRRWLRGVEDQQSETQGT